MAPKLAVLRKYISFKEQMAALQAELRELRPEVLELLEVAPDRRLTVDDKTLCLSTKQRTWFDMKSAKEKIAKALKPFLKTKEYQEIIILGEIEDEEADE